MWIWALQSDAGQHLSTLTGASSRKLSYRRSGTPEANFDVDLWHDDAYAIQDALELGVPKLRAFRLEEQADTSLLAVCRFAGIIMPLDETGSSDTLSVTARGAFEVLEGRFTADLFARDLTPAADTAVDLLDDANAEWPTGILTGSVELTELRDTTFEAKRVSEGIIELADAFDFELVPLADGTGQGADLARFDAWVRQGIDRPGAVFGFGPETVANCTEATRKTLRPVNRVTVTGDEGLTGYADDPASIARYGLWEERESMSDSIDVTRLDGRARELLSPAPVRIVSFTPDPSKTDDADDPITPQPWRDYWLGDTVRLTVRQGSFDYSGAPRVDGIDIELDDEGNETAHTVVVGEL